MPEGVDEPDEKVDEEASFDFSMPLKLPRL